ncbi:MAG: bifunctional proline dehydrogenase/L-glutamate gamma-semialdehyde dehydrogenase PutA [Pseudomonadota bacterium]
MSNSMTRDHFSLQRLRAEIDRDYMPDEEALIKVLLDEAGMPESDLQQIHQLARRWVEQLRARGVAPGSIESFLQEYSLTTDEGVILMCLAESLLRIPDAATSDRLIQDCIARGDWQQHQGKSDSMLVNAATWGLMLTGKVTPLSERVYADAPGALRRLIGRLGEPLVRRAMQQAVRIMGHQFVMGETIKKALHRAAGTGHHQRYSFDMLGEAAMTEEDVERYFAAYLDAITRIADEVDADQPLLARHGISVKLSALHPRYEFSQRARVMHELSTRVLILAQHAKRAGITMTIDAEESERLTLSLDVFKSVYEDVSLGDWAGLGLAVQAYQTRARAVIDWVIALARQGGRRIPVRLVKGAYWDSEIKRAQQAGYPGYPVFTRKSATDVSYLACAKKILAASDIIYPQFATHNARTLASILTMAGEYRDYEFQRLHGMGEALYQILHETHPALPCRVYAPVGGYDTLLPYLVRRLLENGANTSFINRIWDEQQPVEAIIADPVSQLAALSQKPNPRIPLPTQLYGPKRPNSIGINLSDEYTRGLLFAEIASALEPHHAAPRVGDIKPHGVPRSVVAPWCISQVIGSVIEADERSVRQAVDQGAAAYARWSLTTADMRAGYLEQAASLFEDRRAELLALIVREAGKTVPDAIAELREAVDFCRYYAAQARADFAVPMTMPGPTGEINKLFWHGRGVFVCVSPWNFPLAIFVGQIAAALAAGNCVIAKPSHQTPLIAHRAVELLHGAGIPADVLQFLPCSGAVLSQCVLQDERIAGVAFTGSTGTALHINRQLAARPGAIVPLIAETGGQNAMIVDSSALPEQVVRDAMRSAFNSAGQRCSALRVLYLQHEVADRIISMLQGAMAELQVGDPCDLATDVGPVIDEEAVDKLTLHIERFVAHRKVLYQTPLPEAARDGYFIAPTLIELDSIAELHHEVFGPVLHVIRYPAEGLDRVLDEINGTGYGLTLGVHSRIEQRIDYICSKARVGNIYINRDIIGAVVGVQPFGGEGMSGTGFKAGGPHYLYRFASERSISNNIAAIGGNTTLLTLEDGA